MLINAERKLYITRIDTNTNDFTVFTVKRKLHANDCTVVLYF